MAEFDPRTYKTVKACETALKHMRKIMLPYLIKRDKLESRVENYQRDQEKHIARISKLGNQIVEMDAITALLEDGPVRRGHERKSVRIEGQLRKTERLLTELNAQDMTEMQQMAAAYRKLCEPLEQRVEALLARKKELEDEASAG